MEERIEYYSHEILANKKVEGNENINDYWKWIKKGEYM
jgi:hypothetical protein